jgi:hypothetical protein
MFTQLPHTHARAAIRMVDAGWRPGDVPGLVLPPFPHQPSASQWVSDWTWQAMCLRELQSREHPRTA